MKEVYLLNKKRDITANPILFMWNKKDGITKLGILPGKEISAINNNGQVLIKSILETENGKSIQRPVIWENGNITRLYGLEGNIGIEAEESYGLDMNNEGEVVGYSIVNLSYKNKIYKQSHAVKWESGQPIDLHKKIPKSKSSIAMLINDSGDIIVNNYLILAKGEILSSSWFNEGCKSNENYFYTKRGRLHNRSKNRWDCIVSIIQNKFIGDHDNIWMHAQEISGVNDRGEIITSGETVYGEKHAILLIPINSD